MSGARFQLLGTRYQVSGAGKRAPGFESQRLGMAPTLTTDTRLLTPGTWHLAPQSWTEAEKCGRISARALLSPRKPCEVAMRFRKTLTFLILAMGLVLTLSAWAQEKPFTMDQVVSMVRAGLGNDLGQTHPAARDPFHGDSGFPQTTQG